MKKLTTIILMIMTCVFTFTACQKEVITEAETVMYDNAEETTYHNEISESMYEQYKDVGFKIPAGEYYTYKDDKKWQQWHFEDNMKDGNYIDYTEMMGLGFEYFVVEELGENKVKGLFHFGSPDEDTYVTIERNSDEKYTLTYEYGDVKINKKTNDPPFNFGQ